METNTSNVFLILKMTLITPYLVYIYLDFIIPVDNVNL